MQSPSRHDTWSTVRQERLQLVADLAPLDPDRFREPSLCPGWDVHDVLAHLVDTALTTRRAFVVGLALARFDFDRQNARGVARRKGSTPGATLESMRAVVDLRLTPPAPLATRLVEAIVHGEDIRRPLGILPRYPSEAVAHALRHQLRTSTAVGGAREHVAGLRLSATDADVTHGESGHDEVSGPALELLLLVSGRGDATTAVDGPGRELLRTRTTA